MRITATVVVEIDDDAAVLLDQSAVGGAGGTVGVIIRNALTNTPGFKSVIVDVEDTGDEVETGGAAFRSAAAPRELSGTLSKAIAGRSGGMSGGARKATPSGKRMGRPKTLTDMEASDGQPVREWGDRSPESLHAAGISTRPVGGNEDWTPPLAPKRTKSAAPATKGYTVGGKPPVVSRRRGK